MFDLKIKVSVLGIVIFILPMLINIVYVILPPANAPKEEAKANQILELIEQITRILYAVAMVALVSKQKINDRSIWLYIGILFLVLYYVVWIRYFAGGRDVALLGKRFLFIPMPLAIFPVLYYLCAAMWVHNYIAAGLMLIFGAAHNIISYFSLYQRN